MAQEKDADSNQMWKQTFTYDRSGNRRFDEANTTISGRLLLGLGKSDIFPFDLQGLLIKKRTRNFQFGILLSTREIESDSPTSRQFQFIMRFDNDNNGTLTKYQNGLGIDDKLKVSTKGTAKYFLQDHLGSIVGLTNSSDAVIEQTFYDSFGSQSNGLSTHYGYTGREYDSFTGLNYYRARWYDLKTGRFNSKNTIGFIDQFEFFPLNNTTKH